MRSEQRGERRNFFPLRGSSPNEPGPFSRDKGNVFHTYSTYGRGVEVMMGTYNLLDLVPKGRDEDHLSHTMEWVRHHDRYEPAPVAKAATTGGSYC